MNETNPMPYTLTFRTAHSFPVGGSVVATWSGCDLVISGRTYDVVEGMRGMQKGRITITSSTTADFVAFEECRTQ